VATRYRACRCSAAIEKHTTLTLTPQQIHDIGLKEVARIEAEMRTTKDKANFNGTMAEFFTFLRTDPQFYAKTPRELLSYSAYVAKKADGQDGMLLECRENDGYRIQWDGVRSILFRRLPPG
jgi:uncharacterized protein (DUF885 family)